MEIIFCGTTIPKCREKMGIHEYIRPSTGQNKEWQGIGPGEKGELLWKKWGVPFTQPSETIVIKNKLWRYLSSHEEIHHVVGCCNKQPSQNRNLALWIQNVEG